MGRRLLSIALLVGCATEPPSSSSPCDQAAETLERCAGQLPAGFREACDADPEQVASSILAEASADACPDAARSDSITEHAFVDACAAVVNATYWIVWARSPSSQPMSLALRDELRPWFGDLVDTTRVSYDAQLIGRWRVFGHDLIFDDDTIAQTFGNEIFLREPRRDDHAQIALVGHELAHARQYREHGGSVGTFARAYCEAFHDAKFSYRNNALEIEAYDEQDAIKACLDNGQGCPE